MDVTVSMLMVQAGGTELERLGVSSEDAQVLTHSHPNVVLVGQSQTTEAVLLALTPHLRPPVDSVTGVESLPSLSKGTLILRQLDTLDWQAQQDLLAWLDGPGSGTQVVSLTSAPLYPRVKRGTFLDTLYYRLNTLHLEPSH
jgi:hypothetical protein